MLFFYFWNRPKQPILTFHPLFGMKKEPNLKKVDNEKE